MARLTYSRIAERLYKAQSAMEYLMTYGWAILIIAVVLGALFQLGVFNPMTFAPKAPPGSCQVFRPNGPGTTQFINLEGICSGEMPQYVAQFNGQNGYISTGYAVTTSSTVWTLEAWMDPANLDQLGIVVENGWDNGGNSNGYGFGVGNGAGSAGAQLQGLFSDVTWIATGYTFPSANTWYNVVMTRNQSGITSFYVNGVKTPDTSSATPKVPNDTYIGSDTGIRYFDGSIANVQIYNTSLSANEIQALYLEGIGGAPIRLQNLVGWWPLDGNANDYSGNGNNGQINNVNFVSNWYSGYTPP